MKATITSAIEELQERAMHLSKVRLPKLKTPAGTIGTAHGPNSSIISAKNMTGFGNEASMQAELAALATAPAKSKKSVRLVDTAH